MDEQRHKSGEIKLNANNTVKTSPFLSTANRATPPSTSSGLSSLDQPSSAPSPKHPLASSSEIPSKFTSRALEHQTSSAPSSPLVTSVAPLSPSAPPSPSPAHSSSSVSNRLSVARRSNSSSLLTANKLSASSATTSPAPANVQDALNPTPALSGSNSTDPGGPLSNASFASQQEKLLQRLQSLKESKKALLAMKKTLSSSSLPPLPGMLV